MENIDITKFVFGGKAIFTIVSKNTGTRFTYKVNKHKENDIYFVSVLNGKDNNSDYNYMGTIFEKKNFKLTKKSRITDNALSFKAFNWFFHNFKSKTITEKIDFFHEGKCARCGKTLTVPESIKSGFGPFCLKKISNNAWHLF